MIRSKLQWIHWQFSRDLQSNAPFGVLKKDPCGEGVSAASARRHTDLRHFQHEGCVPAYACGSPPATLGKMAAPTWPTRSRRMLRDAAFVRHEVDTIFRRAVHLEPHIRTETAGAIDLSLPGTRPSRYRPRVQQVTSLKT